jgi:hypothetical protein
MDEILNSLGFRKIETPQYNAMGLLGHINWRMPDLKRLVEMGYKLGNFRDAALGSMEKYNPLEHIDRREFETKRFTFIGNPVLADPLNGDERIIINDLEQRIFAPLKYMILNVNSDTVSLDAKTKEKEFVDFYNKIKAEGGRFVTVLSHDAIRFGDSEDSLNELREIIINGLFLGNETECNDFLKYVQKSKKTHDRRDTLKTMFAYSGEIYTNLNFIYRRSMSNEFEYRTNALIEDTGCVFVVNPATFLKQQKDKSDSKIGKTFLYFTSIKD